MLRNKKNNAFSLVELAVVILIIGILVAAISQGGRLVTKSKLTAGKQLTSTSPLQTMPNVEVWLETSADNAFSASMSNKDPVADEKWVSNNRLTGYKAINVGGDTYPVYRSDIGINDLPILEFDVGSDNYNGTLHFDGSAYDSIDYTVIAVMAANSGSTEAFFECTVADGSDTPYVRLPIINVAQDAIHTYRVTHSSNTLAYYQNGTAVVDPTNGGTFSLDPNFDAGQAIDQCYFGGRTDYEGKMAEFVFLSGEVSDDELNEIHEYLGKKYKIPVADI